VMTKVRAEVRTPESPPYHLPWKMMIRITSSWSYFKARRTETSHDKLQGFHCSRPVALSILLLNALCFQIPDNHLGQWHHHYSNVYSQPSSTNLPSLTMHHPPRRCHNPSLVETRMFHNTRPVHIRTFPYTERLLLR